MPKVKNKHPLSMPIKMVWVTVFMLGFFNYISDHYSIYIDTQDEKCLPENTVYLLIKGVGDIQRGDLYAFNIMNNDYFEDGTKFGKFIEALPNDEITVDGNGLTINNHNYSHSLVHYKRYSDNVEDIYTNYVVSEGNYFFATKSDISYDSRYYGTIPKEQLVGRLIPIW